MPRRTDLKHILVIGSGPIVIGQACEFDYSGTQACRVLQEEGLRVSLVNSNPATIMTDPEFADATYVEPITAEFLEKVIAKEALQGNKIDAVLATLGGQTALNAAVALHEQGILEKYDVELIGADFDAIQRGEDRQKFKDIVAKVGGESAKSAVCYTMDEVHATVAELGYPVVVRPSFTMGGLGSGMAYDVDDLNRIAGGGLAASPTANVLIEESILGWKEYELELMRDSRDNVVIVCSIENVDPVGVHTGDSVTVAPAMTLTDREYQAMRDLSIDILREVGVDTGGCNIQFAMDPKDGRLVVIEMNPRVSRLVGSGVEGDRLPDREDGGQACHRLHARRDRQRHHQGNPGLLRADARLRRRQGSAVRFREVPRCRRNSDHYDEVGGRGHEHRPQLHRGFRQGHAFARDQACGLLDRRRHRDGEPGRPARRSERSAGRPHVRHREGIRPRRNCRAALRRHQDRSVVPRPVPADSRAR